MADKGDKKILFLINKLGIGGAERVFIKDANSLTSKGYSVHFAFVYGKEKDQILLPNLNIDKQNIYYCKSSGVFDFTAILKLSKYIKNNGINTVYATLNESNFVARLLKLFNPSIKVVIREANVAGPKPLKYKILDILMNFLVYKIICVSEEVENSLKIYQPFYSYKMEVLTNGINVPEKYKEYSQEIKLPIQIINVGSLTPKKGHKYLIEACSIIEKNYPRSFCLIIIGEGQERGRLEKLIRDLDLEEKVFLLGSMSPNQVSEYYLKSDLFILSSLHEGCPNVLLEAMAHGLVSISTKVSGVAGILDSGNYGKIVCAGDSHSIANEILFFINNYISTKYLGKSARDRAINLFSQEAHINRLISIIG